jgi:hypothetical protein
MGIAPLFGPRFSELKSRVGYRRVTLFADRHFAPQFVGWSITIS